MKGGHHKMNPKIKKINAELDKNAAKIAELQARQKELIQQRTELENNDILDLVHSHDLDFTQLAALIRSMKTCLLYTSPSPRDS